MKMYQVEWELYGKEGVDPLEEGKTFIMAESSLDALQEFKTDHEIYTDEAYEGYVVTNVKPAELEKVYEVSYEHHSSRGIENETILICAESSSDAIKRFLVLEEAFDYETGVGSMVTDVKCVE